MKTRLVLALLFSLSTQYALSQASDPQYKVKSKNGVVRVQDKSKPVRTALEAEYAKMRQAYFDDDPEPVIATRASDYAAVLPEGGRWTREDAVAYVRAGFDQVERTLALSFDIDSLDVQGDTAIVNIHQQWKRMQQKAGKLRNVETEAYQREWWRKTPEGWRCFLVDDVRRGVWKVDGKRIDPSKPYDPDAPPFEP